MLPPLATTDDFVVRLGRAVDDDAELARIDALLADASTLVRLAAGVTWVEDNALVADIPDTVALIVLTAARRAFDNPEGIAQKSVDDVSVSYVRASQGGLYLTPEEKAILSSLGGGRAGLWTLSTTRGDNDLDEYLDVIGHEGAPSEPIPFLPAGW